MPLPDCPFFRAIMISVRLPATSGEFEAYYDLRWRILRAPLSQPRGSECDDLENTSFHVMAMEGERIVGVGRMHPTDDNEAQIRYMAVEQGHERRGIGSMVLESLQNHAIETGITMVWLNARISAVEFYECRGYRIVKPSKTLYGTVQHHRMEKSL